jgi:hypothetical protein
MQDQLDAEMTAEQRPIEISGINGAGLESGNSGITPGRHIPWLQDVAEQNVWGTWRVNQVRPAFPSINYRDVVVLDERNHPIAVYNLTEHDLGNATNFATLKAILRAAASR